MHTNNIGVIGIGRLGLSFALIAERQGYTVYGADTRQDYVNNLNTRLYTSAEPYINEYLNAADSFVASVHVSIPVKQCDILFCFVATPSLADGSYDHSAVDSVVDQLIELDDKGADLSGKILVIGCTTMPGYTQTVQERLDATGMFVAYNPEFIAQGSIIDGLRNADMVLMGVSEDSTYEALKAIYRTIMDKEPVISRMSPTAAEITKISINCYLAMKIAYANMIGEIAINSNLESEIPDILKAIGSDSRIGHKYLGYGFGYGGPCIPRDGKALSVYMEDVNIKARIPVAADNANEAHANFILQYFTKQNPDKTVPFIFPQLTYKKGVDILTESQQLRLAMSLEANGYTVYTTDTADTHISKLPVGVTGYTITI
jgi:UDPglucose 6-dehydrogenase